MAGMFYSLKEAAQRLGVGEDQVKQLAKDGKLREFRDGSNLLFKIEEVNALVAEGIDITAEDLELPADELAAEALGDTAAAALGESVEDDIFKLDEEATPASAAQEGSEASDLDLIPERKSRRPRRPSPKRKPPRWRWWRSQRPPSQPPKRTFCWRRVCRAGRRGAGAAHCGGSGRVDGGRFERGDIARPGIRGPRGRQRYQRYGYRLDRGGRQRPRRDGYGLRRDGGFDGGDGGNGSFR